MAAPPVPAVHQPGLTGELSAAAREAGCVVDASFAQIAHVMNPLGPGPHDGVCWGLSTTWLDLLERGEGGTFARQVTGPDRGPTDRRVQVQARQNLQLQPGEGLNLLLPTTRMTDTGKRGNLTFVHPAGVTLKQPDAAQWYRIKRRSSAATDLDTNDRYIISADDVENGLNKLVEWFNATTGKRRFFLIHLMDGPRHSMAAAKNRKGRLRFYDPNGGIASTWFSTNMTNFLRLYFSSHRVFDNYHCTGPGQANQIRFTVEKFRPNSW